MAAPYSRVNWVDYPSQNTPVDATNLNQMDAGIAAAAVSGLIANSDVASAAALAISKLADPGSGKVIGSVGSGAVAVNPPGYEIGYTAITSNVNVTATSESSGTTIISPGALTFDGGAVICEFFSPQVVPPNATSTTNFLVVNLFENTTQITRLFVLENIIGTAASQVAPPCYGRYRFTPTAGPHTYTVTAFVSGTGGTPLVGAGVASTAGASPAFVRFIKV